VGLFGAGMLGLEPSGCPWGVNVRKHAQFQVLCGTNYSSLNLLPIIWRLKVQFDLVFSGWIFGILLNTPQDAISSPMLVNFTAEFF